MAAKRFWATTALVSLLGLAGCRSYCEQHYPCPQQASCCQPCCTPSYQPQACCTPAPNPCAPAPAYGPPPQQWAQPPIQPVPAR
jgi:hypothetical protein